jgi:hypothetical protein
MVTRSEHYLFPRFLGISLQASIPFLHWIHGLATESMQVLECTRYSILFIEKYEGVAMASFALDAARTALVVIDITKGVLSLPTVPYPVQEVLANRIASRNICLCFSNVNRFLLFQEGEEGQLWSC